MRFIGKQLVYFNSSLDWQQSPQQLQIAPGQLEDILNIGMPYDQLEQRVDYNAFSFINSAYFIRRFGAWRIRPMLGLHYLRNHIQSELQIKSLEEEIQLGEEYRNDIQHSWIKAATGATLGFRKRALGGGSRDSLYPAHHRRRNPKCFQSLTADSLPSQSTT